MASSECQSVLGGFVGLSGRHRWLHRPHRDRESQNGLEPARALGVWRGFQWQMRPGCRLRKQRYGRSLQALAPCEAKGTSRELENLDRLDLLAPLAPSQGAVPAARRGVLEALHRPGSCGMGEWMPVED